MEPLIEGSQTGIAIDGSVSMAKNGSFGIQGAAAPKSVSREIVFGEGRRSLAHYVESKNQIQSFCQEMVPYLAEKLDADGGTTVIYWACGAKGGAIEELGDFSADQARSAKYSGPQVWGTGTKLLPALSYFVDRFEDADWGFYVFVTDGRIDDMEAVIQYSLKLAKSIKAGKRKPVKLVLIGVGAEVDEAQLAALDDLPDTHDAQADLWDHKIAADLRSLTDVFAEVVDAGQIVAPFGRVRDESGKIIAQWSDGLPAAIEFEIAKSAKFFILEVPGGEIKQPLV